MSRSEGVPNVCDGCHLPKDELNQRDDVPLQVAPKRVNGKLRSRCAWLCDECVKGLPKRLCRPAKLNTDPKTPPKVGDVIYVPTRLYIGHPEDDVQGGLAEVTEVKVNQDLPEFNRYYVYVREHPGRGVNWAHVATQQEELAKEFGENTAYPDPDYNRYE